MQENGFVGREDELEQLDTLLHKALSGTGQVCFVAGQAGSGKTALVHQFLKHALASDPDLVVGLGNCNAQTGIGDPYLPFREALAMLTGDSTAEHSASKLPAENARRLQGALVRSVQVLVEVAPELIGIFVPGVTLLGHVGRALAKKAGWMDQLDELAKRKPGASGSVIEQSRIFEQYTAFLQQLSSKAPLILFLDDLQWADTASLGLLFHLGRHIQGSRIVILGAFRPNDIAVGRGGGRHPLEPVIHELTGLHGDVCIDLDAIPETRSRRFVDAILDAEPNMLSEAFRESLFHQTGGHALFTVELIEAMRERGDLIRDVDGRWVEGPSLQWSALPARVEGVIEERVARLSDELRQMLIVGSVEGEQFTAEVVARVQAISERQAIRALSNELQKRHHLVGALGVVQLGYVQVSVYRFLHNLFQQYLYGSLGDAERAYLHRDMGEAMEELFAGETEEVAAQLARHFEEGGIPAKAAAYRLQAGKRAHRMSAHYEAATHLTKGLELLERLPLGPERTQSELSMQITLGTTLIALNGYASPQVEQAFSRARELCRVLGDPPQVIPALYGLALFRLVRAELKRAYEEGEQLLLLAQRAGNDGYAIGCQALLGASSLYMGRPEQARGFLEAAISAYDRTRHADLAPQQGQDPCVAALSYLSWTLWALGYPEQAIQKSNAAVELASELKHAYSQGMALAFASKLHEMRREWDSCEAQSLTALEAANKGSFSLWKAMATMVYGAALAYQGRVDEGITALLQGMVGLRATGALLSASYHATWLAQVYLLARRREEGLHAVDESFSTLEQTWWLPEQYRLRAELLLLEPGFEPEAEATLRQALDLARSQQSRSLELRAAMSLARLLRRQGRRAEARAALAESYSWFSEGLETRDLQDARELLEELARSQDHRTESVTLIDAPIRE